MIFVRVDRQLFGKGRPNRRMHPQHMTAEVDQTSVKLQLYLVGGSVVWATFARGALAHAFSLLTGVDVHAPVLASPVDVTGPFSSRAPLRGPTARRKQTRYADGVSAGKHQEGLIVRWHSPTGHVFEIGGSLFNFEQLARVIPGPEGAATLEALEGVAEVLLGRPEVGKAPKRPQPDPLLKMLESTANPSTISPCASADTSACVAQPTVTVSGVTVPA